MEKIQNNNSLNPLYLLTLAGCVLAGVIVGGLITYILAWVLETDVEGLLTLADQSSFQDRTAAKAAIGIHHLFTFVIPSLVTAWLLFKQFWTNKMDLNKAPTGQNMLIVLVFMLLLPPLIALVYWVNKNIPLPEALSSMEAKTNTLIEQMLVFEHPMDLILNILIMAVIPAIGEELLFRGHLQKLLGKWMSNPHMGIWIAAFLFSAMHMQFEGFFPRMMLGSLLGYLFYWTGNLWIAIWGHFVNNAYQLVVAYFLADEMSSLDPSEVQFPDTYQLLLFTTLAALLLFFFYRKNKIRTSADDRA